MSVACSPRQSALLLLTAVTRVRMRAAGGPGSGDVEGHDFHGNQWTSGSGGSSATVSHLDKQFPTAGKVVSGLTVRDGVPNMSSIESSLNDYHVLPGVREVSMSSMDPEYKVKPYSVSESNRLDNLEAQIRSNKEISPLIVVVDKEKHPYILEGGHRYDALRRMGVKSFPAKVVIDTESIDLRHASQRALGGPGSGDVPGHEFHGNQWTNGSIGDIAKNVDVTKGPVAIGSIKTTVYRVGPTTESEVYLAGTHEDAKAYSSLHAGHEVRAYPVETRNTLVATGHHQLYTHLNPGKSLNDAIYKADKASFKSTGGRGDSVKAFRDVQRKMMNQARRAGYDSVLFKSPPAPAKEELVLLSPKNLRSAGAFPGVPSRDQTPVHAAADAHLSAMTAAVHYAFLRGRKVLRQDPRDAVAAAAAVRDALLRVLPPVLLKTVVAGGMAGVKTLRTAGGAGSGDVPGHEFHGNQYTVSGSITDKEGKTYEVQVHQRLYPGNDVPKQEYRVVNENGHTVASAELRREKKAVSSVYVHEQRKGIATALYKHIEQHLGYKLEPNAALTDEGKAFWKSRGASSFRSLKPQVEGQPHDTIGIADLAFNVTDPNAEQWAQDHAGELAKGISDTVQSMIQDAVAAAVAGDGVDAAYQDILDAVGDPARAEMIARTETMTAANEGQRQGWAQAADAGLLDAGTQVEWIATSDACPDCADLDGETRDLDGQYPDPGGDGPPLHPNSLVAGTVVAGDTIAATRMSYAGQVREVVTAAGRRLAVTPHHAVATTRGFIQARDVQEGDQLLSYAGCVEAGRVDVTTPQLLPMLPHDEEHGPTLIENVFSTLVLTGKLVTSRRLGTEFHGDAAYGDGDIDVVYADVELGNSIEAKLAQHDQRLGLEASGRSTTRNGAAGTLLDGLTVIERTFVPALRTLAKPPLDGRVRAVTQGDTALGESRSKSPSCQTGLIRQREQGLTVLVAGDECVDEAIRDRDATEPHTLKVGTTAQLDAVLLELLSESLTRDASFVRELEERLPGLIARDEVVQVQDVDYFGHVYDLSTVSGVIVAENLIISNCRCTEGIAA